MLKFFKYMFRKHVLGLFGCLFLSCIHLVRSLRKIHVSSLLLAGTRFWIYLKISM